jgi:hypothetical protein
VENGDMCHEARRRPAASTPSACASRNPAGSEFRAAFDFESRE